MALLTQSIEGIRRGTDKTAAELAIRRLTEEALRLRHESEAKKHELSVSRAGWASKISDAKSGSLWYLVSAAGAVFFVVALFAVTSLDARFQGNTMAQVISRLALILAPLGIMFLIWILGTKNSERKVRRLSADRDRIVPELSARVKEIESMLRKTEAGLKKHHATVNT